MGVDRRSGVAALLAGACVYLSAVQEVHATSLEVYGRLPTLENVAISPDGSKLAFVRTTQDVRALAIVGLADHKFLGGAKFGEVKMRHIMWADDSHLLIETSATQQAYGLTGEKEEWFQLTVFDLATRRLQSYPDPALQPDVHMMNVISGEPMVRHLDKGTVLFIPGIYVSNLTQHALFRVDLATGRQTLIRKGVDGTRGWLVDEAGEIVAESRYYEQDQRWQLRVRHDGQWLDGESGHSAIELPSMLGFGPAGDSVLVEAVEDGDPVWKTLSLKDGKFGPRTEQGAGAESRPIEDPFTHRIIGGVRGADDPNYAFFDTELQGRWNSIASAYQGERLQIESTSSDLKKFVVKIEGSTHGYRFALIDMNTVRAIPLGDVYEGLTQLLEVRHITYPAADGMKIPAYLTLPPGRVAAKLPLIVLPHGGPAASTTAGFDWWAQALASQGYAVLQPNFRGSSLSRSYLSSGFGEWGRKMQTDLSDGVRFLAKEGIVDPARVCIMGGSYGGYAALAGVTLDPGVYRCAVSVAGISDLRLFLEWVNDRDYYGAHTTQRYWDRFMGVTSHKDPPIKHLDKVNVPVLFIHGKDDTVVPYEQSEVMLKALRNANKKVDLVTLKNEDHWLSRSETRLQMLQSSVEFLRANNPPD
jgi:dipeptidyl aminopeptidase/acylaminoacyl peptidase